MSRSSWFVRLLSSSLWGVLSLFVVALLHAGPSTPTVGVIAFTLYYGSTSVLGVVIIGVLFRHRLLESNRRTKLAALGLCIAASVLMITVNALYRTSNDLPAALAWICAVALSLSVFALKRSK